MSDPVFYFDFGSLNAYFAWRLLPGIEQRTGARFEQVAVLLGGIFKATGNHIPAESPAKARWMLGDLTRWAGRYGVPFRMNGRFPINAIPAMRLVLVGERHGLAREVALEAFRRMWVEDQDPNEHRAAIAAAAGLPAGAEQGVADPEIKVALRANTDEAIARGAFGAPAMFVGDQLFWGTDRLDFVEAALR